MIQSLVIVPSRHRNEQHKEFVKEFQSNSTASDLMFVLDRDNEQVYERMPGVIYHVHDTQTRGIGEPLNSTALANSDRYKYIGFMGDDHRTRTPGWDQTMIDGSRHSKTCVCYGDDLIQGKLLPTAVLLSANIVSTLGFMAPPVLKHLYLDEFWRDLGKALGSLFYFPEVVIEHMHHSQGKSLPDKTYSEAGDKATRRLDRDAYRKYQAEQMALDVEKLR